MDIDIYTHTHTYIYIYMYVHIYNIHIVTRGFISVKQLSCENQIISTPP